MTTLVLLARLGLSAVFLASALAKLGDRPGSRQAVRDFGVPEVLTDAISGLLPLAELALAFALLPVTSATWAAAGSIVLLGIFSAAIAINLARGRHPDCHCFGALSSKPIGWSTVIRNLGLMALGAFVLVAGRTPGQLSAVSWLQTLPAPAVMTLAIGVLALLLSFVVVWLLLQLLGQHGRLLLRLEAMDARLAALPAAGGGPNGFHQAQENHAPVGFPPGTPAPEFELQGLYGERMTLASLRSAGKPVLLLFGDPNCGPCNALMPDVGRWQRELVATLNVTVVSRGDLEDNRSKRGEHALTQVLLQEDWEVSNAYQAAGTPTAVLIRPDGTIGSYVAQGTEEIRALVSRQISP